MNRIIFILIINITLSFNNIFALEEGIDSSKVYQSKGVTVLGQRSSESISNIGRVIRTVEKIEIQSIPSNGLIDLLANNQNIDVRQRGPYDIQADISINGGTFDQAMILLNGINISDPQTGHYSVNLPLDINSITKVEIMEGATARSLGPGALTGAINFIALPSDTNEFSAHLTAGQYGLANLVLNSSFGLGKTRNLITGAFKNSTGYINNTDFRAFNIYYQCNYETENFLLRSQIGGAEKNFGANSFYSAKYPNQFEDNKTAFASVTYRSKNELPVSTSVYYRTNQDRFELFRELPPAWYKKHNYHLTEVFGSDFNLTIPHRSGKIEIGFDIRNENILSTVLGESISDSVKALFEPKDIYYNKYYSRTNFSFNLDEQIDFYKFTFKFGAMLNFNSALFLRPKLYPGVDIVYKPFKNINITASLNKALRLPTFTDMFYKGPINQGNKNLKPEESLSGQLNLEYFNENYSIGMNSFYRRGTNIIDWARKPNEDIYYSSNISEMETIGFTLFANFYPEKYLKSDFIEAVKINYCYMEQYKNADKDYISYYVMDYLKNKFNIILEHKIYSGISATWLFSFQERMGTYKESTSGLEKKYEPYYLVNGKIKYSYKNLLLSLDATNILSQEYYYFADIPQPKLWVKLNIEYKMKI